jgi:hypothetical protein
MQPRFEFIEDRGYWSECRTCGRLAWDHEQADPLADIRNHLRVWVDGDSTRDYPPTMTQQ